LNTTWKLECHHWLGSSSGKYRVKRRRILGELGSHCQPEFQQPQQDCSTDNDAMAHKHLYQLGVNGIASMVAQKLELQLERPCLSKPSVLPSIQSITNPHTPIVVNQDQLGGMSFNGVQKLQAPTFGPQGLPCRTLKHTLGICFVVLNAGNSLGSIRCSHA
jgi:hypothetical protein